MRIKFRWAEILELSDKEFKVTMTMLRALEEKNGQHEKTNE